MGYGICGLWAANSFASLYYFAIPSICLLKGISMFPKVSSVWFIPFAYVTVAKQAYSRGDTLLGWWNAQRMWVFKRVTSYLYGTIDAIFNIIGLSQTAFALTQKVSDPDQSKRYEQEIIEFGASSPMFIIIATYALLNLICLVEGVRKLVMDKDVDGLEQLMLQLILSGAMVLVNAPVYFALLVRKDKGNLPSHVMFTSFGFAMLACLLPII